ncbi:MAG: xanthine dehydrogenase family protein molybdopterin-binding subunit [Porticoccaceae bacterium]|jgi:isoquinoline 1-oxidoreductase subunit beta|nr:xanthine dehydrogenase family protein molybdopterin-binding subunit [Porticoccaceae bacterium]MDG1312388.1 xanthine dehydrogenase family protein molybdopterin-binding subunit [Porticoccaceae bacterium]
MVSRRRFLKTSATFGAGFTLSMTLPAAASKLASGAAEAKTVANAFVRISSDNLVSIMIKHIEFGQGTFTGLATIVAEEMDADWDQIVAEAAPANKELYSNLLFGAQGTGGSTAIANSYTQMREAGASARAMLVAAAAQQWGVPVAEITVSKGLISHASGRYASFGEMAGAAAEQEVPKTVVLKDPANFTLIGAETVSRKDLGKTDGTAIYTQDIKLPGMLTAVVAHAPRFGAKVKSYNDINARAVKGVVNVVQIDSGVAVLADTFWNAKKGRDALQIDWDTSVAMSESSEEQMQRFRQTAQQPGLPAVAEGDIAKGFENAAQIIEAEYEFPYVAHATMEPMNCVAQITDAGAEAWYGCQSTTSDQYAIASTLKVAPEKVKINTLFAGGSFGRRASKNSDYVLEAVQIAKANKSDAPVKLVWTREDDTNSGYFRPMYFHKMKAGLDSGGKIIAWHHQIVGQSIMANSALSMFIKNGIDGTSVEGATELPYHIANFAVNLNTVESQVPVLWWRSVGSTHTAHAVENFMDQLAAAADTDPLAFRLANLGDDTRYRGVLDLVAEKAGWNAKNTSGRLKGLALHKSFGSYVAQVADLSVDKNGNYKVDRVVCAVDCGVAINPDVIRAQMEGGIGYGLSPALMTEITIENGAVVESNFDKQQVLRIADMPEIEVHIVPSAEAPTGVGEPGTPVIGPAVANALFAMTGKPRPTLPLGVKV